MTDAGLEAPSKDDAADTSSAASGATLPTGPAKKQEAAIL